MKVLFLDIDGPLVTYRAHMVKGVKGSSTKHGDKFDPICVGLVNLICEKTLAKIVISSTWRSGDDVCKNQLIAAGIAENHFHADHETPRLDKRDARYGGILVAVRRGYEIQAWLDAHPLVNRYVILDDDRDMLDSQLASFVQVDFDNGIQISHYTRCLEILEEI